jgi:hypothetical protein
LENLDYFTLYTINDEKFLTLCVNITDKTVKMISVYVGFEVNMADVDLSGNSISGNKFNINVFK